MHCFDCKIISCILNSVSSHTRWLVCFSAGQSFALWNRVMIWREIHLNYGSDKVFDSLCRHDTYSAPLVYVVLLQYHTRYITYMKHDVPWNEGFFNLWVLGRSWSSVRMCLVRLKLQEVLSDCVVFDNTTDMIHCRLASSIFLQRNSCTGILLRLISLT